MTQTAAADAAPKTFAALREMIDSRRLRFADFWFTDLAGLPWRITMPTDALTEGLFSAGLPLDGQPIGGAWDGVMLLAPRLESAYPDPAAEVPTLAMICDVLDPRRREPLELEPRHVLSRAVQEVRDRLGAEIAIGAEPEFFLLDEAGKPARESEVWDFLRDFGGALSAAGIRVDWFRTGPAVGQGRVQMRSGPALPLADRVMIYRNAAVSLARRRRMTVSFLPRPIEGEGTAGMPVHQTLRKEGRNLFHDDGGWALTSQLCRWYAGGVLAHLPALLAICAPTTNSYRRLIPGFAGPTEALLSAVSRRAACRIPARSLEPDSRRVKFCSPDSSANPYLAFAAIILAGLDGIERRIEAPLDGAAPAPVRLPQSLESALESLDQDRGFLIECGAFSNGIIEAWIKDRWINHVLPVRMRPHPLELGAEARGGVAKA